MAMNAGDAACTTGLSARVYSYLVADVRNGFSGTMTSAQSDSVKALCYAISRAVVDEIGSVPTGRMDRPVEPVVIDSVEISES